jgi:hypothetical protein
LAANGEDKIITVSLIAFLVLWVCFQEVSHQTIDVHSDISEESLWSQDFSLGFKHPPLSAWIFKLWFMAFPRADWAAYLLAGTMVATMLAVIWRLLRDYVDRDRALLGIVALMFVPLFTFHAAKFNANTVMMPFWAAAVLFYLRARRGLGSFNSFLAGLFTWITFLGKYWAIYLVAGMAITSFIGTGTKRFWRSPAPYLMALSASFVVAPHLYWLLTEHAHPVEHYLQDTVMTPVPFWKAVAVSLFYLCGVVAYVAIPLIFFAGLRPSRAACFDTFWPRDEDRQQALLLLAIPLVLPALANLAFPHRLTALWTFPNWALLPIVLFSSPLLVVPFRGVARAGVAALAFTLGALAVSPYLAYNRLWFHDPDAGHYRQVAAAVSRLSSKRPLITGSVEIVSGLSFYLPKRHIANLNALADHRADISMNGLIIVCLEEDAVCRATTTEMDVIVKNVVLTRKFLGRSGPPKKYVITIVPASASPAS